MDRISSLPDDIICHIGSFLPAKEAAFTTVEDGEKSFTDFVDRVLALPASSRVRSFYLNGVWLEHIEHDVRYDLINRCLFDVHAQAWCLEYSSVLTWQTRILTAF